jgi:hypothetical protein
MAVGIGAVLVAVTTAANAGIAEDKAGFHHALLACAIFLLAAAAIGMRATSSRGESVTEPSGTPAARDQVPAPELTDPPFARKLDT